MKKITFVLCIFFTFSKIYCQNEGTYNNLKNKGIKYMYDGDFASAQSSFNLMRPHITNNNKKEYEKLVKSLQDSISNTYVRANNLRDRGLYQYAIIEYMKLIDKNKEPLIKADSNGKQTTLYANIGFCYEKIHYKDLAKHYYELGVKLNDKKSALQLAKYIRNNNISITSDEIIKLYQKDDCYYASRDSLGIEYAKLGEINESYRWFKESISDFAKYKRASFLLDASTYDKLYNNFKKDDPIQLLTDAANNGYAPAQFYLGLLYYFAKEGERVQKDKTKGMELIQKAANQNYKRAKTIINKIK